MSPSNPPRTAVQNKRLWALVSNLVRDLGLDRDDAEDLLRDACTAVSGQPSTRALTTSQADEVIGRLEDRLGGRRRAPPPPKPETSRAPKRISPAQIKALDQLREAYGLSAQAYRAFCQRTIKRAWPQSSEEASKIYEGLEAMLQRRYPIPALTHLAQTLSTHPTASGQDQAFAMSILRACKAGRRLGAGQIGILLKIGVRYEVHLQALAEPG